VASELRTILHSIEEVVLLLCISDICLYQKTIRFRVDLLHHGLERVKRSRFSDLHIHRELLDDVF
jgi:hypothetical protein